MAKILLLYTRMETNRKSKDNHHRLDTWEKDKKKINAKYGWLDCVMVDGQTRGIENLILVKQTSSSPGTSVDGIGLSAHTIPKQSY